MSDRFRTTSWTLVLTAARQDNTDARDALARLCEAYWPPIYAYLRRQGHGADNAADLTLSLRARG